MQKIQSESRWMRLCKSLGLTRLAWSLRRLHCPVTRDALVLEVGSGGNPYFRANVLLDAFETTRQRHWVPLVADRPTVLGEVERLPFCDNAFDFVIASHVLEHSKDPIAFLSELQRVASAGYIEVPDAFMERINPYLDHRLEVTVRDEKLVIRQKASWCVDQGLVELYEYAAKRYITGETIPRHPFQFHVRFYWQKTIPYAVLNPDVEINWDAPVAMKVSPSPSLKAKLKAWILSLARSVFSQNSRNQKLDLASLLACPSCRSTNLDVTESRIICNSCTKDYLVRNGMPVMLVAEQ